MTQPAGIFISYRRSDAGGHARTLFNQLRLWFDADVLFFDEKTLDMGAPFPEEIARAVEQAVVMLAVIGPDWVSAINHRSDQAETDFVREEIAGALVRGIPIVPVLVGGAAMPGVTQLHAELHDDIGKLCKHDALPLGGKQAVWDSEFVRLREHIAQLAGLTPRFRPPPGVQRPWRIIGHQLSAHFQDPNRLLDRLHTRLSASGSAALVARAALHGMGGLGKTQLALKYSLDYRDRYAGVWWFGAETETTLQLDAQAACEEVGAPIIQGQTPAASFRRWLEQQDAAWLLVFDNAESADALRPYLSQGGPHRMLITSRHPVWNSLATALELEVWSAEQGAAFFAARLPQRGAEDWASLTQDLAGLPLALEQASSYLEKTGISVAAYRGHLADEKKSAALLDKDRPATGYEHTVIATLTLAAAKLTEPARQLLRLLAFAAPEPFPERFVREAEGTLPPELTILAGDELAWNDLITELRAYGLAESSEILALDSETDEASTRSEPAVKLHRLTQQALRARLAKPEEDGPRFESVLLANCPEDAELPEHRPRMAALAPHICGLDRYANANWVDLAVLNWLLGQVTSYLRSFLHSLKIKNIELREAHANLLEKRANLLEERANLLEKHANAFVRADDLASTLKAQGDLAGALELQKSALAMRRSVLGEEHPDTIGSAWNLVQTLHQLKDPATARNLLDAYLLPLLRAAPAALSADLNHIRQQLLDNHDAIERFTGITFPLSPPAP